MTNEKRDSEASTSPYKKAFAAVVVVLTVITSPILFFMFIMAHDSSHRNSLQMGVEIGSCVLALVFVWSLVQVLKD